MARLIFNTKFNTPNKDPSISRLFGVISKGSIPVRSANFKKPPVMGGFLFAGVSGV